MQLLKPMSPEKMNELIQSGRTSEIVAHATAYQEQQEKIKKGEIETHRLCVKFNKSEGVYIASPYLKLKGCSGVNILKKDRHLAMAIAVDKDLREAIVNLFTKGETTDEQATLG